MVIYASFEQDDGKRGRRLVEEETRMKRSVIGDRGPGL